MKKGVSLFIPLILIAASLALTLSEPGIYRTAFAQTGQNAGWEQERLQLQQQLKEIEQEIAAAEASLGKVRFQKNTLANKIQQLKIRQASLTLKIKASSLQLEQSTISLLQIQAQIDQNAAQVTAAQDQLAAVLNKLWQERQVSLFNRLLTADSLAGFFNGMHDLENVSRGIAAMSRKLQDEKADLENNRQSLAEEQQAQASFFNIISLQNSELTANLQDQNDLLRQTKGQEANYQSLIKQNQATANAIRGRIYSLIGTAQQINFGEAVQIATWASSQTGVRPAFLLAILTQESNLGRNVGTCNRAGDPPSKSWRVVMKPERDQEPFKKITGELGKNIDTTPVSCPMRDKNGDQVGWGGAMGPAQFIPSTWLGYRDKVKAITGQAANPWDIRDAFLAAAIKLKADGGATPSGEWAAAMRYFSGSANTAYRFYGDNVVAMADKYQSDIDELNKK
ncbi:MAG: lytic murein transglycosylase [Patescibacteria group bacterium]